MPKVRLRRFSRKSGKRQKNPQKYNLLQILIWNNLEGILGKYEGLEYQGKNVENYKALKMIYSKIAHFQEFSAG